MPKHRKGKMPPALAAYWRTHKRGKVKVKPHFALRGKKEHRHIARVHSYIRSRPSDIGRQLVPLVAGFAIMAFTGGTMSGQGGGGGGGGGGVYGPPSPPPPPPGETNAPKYTVGTQLYWQGTLLYRITSLDYVRRTYHMETTVNGQPYYQDTLWSSVDNSSGWTVAQAY